MKAPMKIAGLLSAVLVWPTSGVVVAQQPAHKNLVGAVQTVDPASHQLTLRTDDGKTVKITLHTGARLLLLPPGGKGLASATPITFNDIGPRDRISARGELSDDESSFVASSLVVTTRARPMQKAKSSLIQVPPGPVKLKISGRIFAITGGGDIKPARMALVVAFYWDSRADSISAGSKYMEKFDKVRAEIKAYYSQQIATNKYESDSYNCLHELVLYSHAYIDAYESAHGNPALTDQALTVDADEEGIFTMTLPRVGTYWLIAHGSAGSNRAIWMEKFDVNADNMSVKLTTPIKACLSEE